MTLWGMRAENASTHLVLKGDIGKGKLRCPNSEEMGQFQRPKTDLGEALRSQGIRPPGIDHSGPSTHLISDSRAKHPYRFMPKKRPTPRKVGAVSRKGGPVTMRGQYGFTHTLVTGGQILPLVTVVQGLRVGAL